MTSCLKPGLRQGGILFLIVLTTGCVTVDLVKGFEQNIKGKWRAEGEGTAGSLLNFKKDRAYQADLNGDSVPEVLGEYGISSNRIWITYLEGSISERCRQPGIYDYKISGTNLVFTLVGDQCQERVELLKKPFGWPGRV